MYLEEEISRPTKRFNSPISYFIKKRRWNMMLLQIYCRISFISLPWLQQSKQISTKITQIYSKINEEQHYLRNLYRTYPETVPFPFRTIFFSNLIRFNTPIASDSFISLVTSDVSTGGFVLCFLLLIRLLLRRRWRFLSQRNRASESHTSNRRSSSPDPSRSNLRLQ